MLLNRKLSKFVTDHYIPTCIIISQNTERMVESSKTNANDSKNISVLYIFLEWPFACVSMFVTFVDFLIRNKSRDLKLKCFYASIALQTLGGLNSLIK